MTLERYTQTFFSKIQHGAQGDEGGGVLEPHLCHLVCLGSPPQLRHWYGNVEGGHEGGFHDFDSGEGTPRSFSARVLGMVCTIMIVMTIDDAYYHHHAHDHCYAGDQYQIMLLQYHVS